MFKELTEGCMPTRATKYSACVDVYASEDVVIGAGETKLVGLGIAIDDSYLFNKFREHLTDDSNKSVKLQAESQHNLFLLGHYLSLKPRSSIRAKGLISHSAVIDLDYKDEIKMIIHNPLSFGKIYYSDDGEISSLAVDDSAYKIKKGDRIGQITLLEHKSYLFGIESEDVREGGFGSTGEQ